MGILLVLNAGSWFILAVRCKKYKYRYRKMRTTRGCRIKCGGAGYF